MEATRYDNETELYDFDVEAIFYMPYSRQIMWSALFSMITVIGTVGNFIIIWIVVTHKNMRSVMNLFLVNLAIVDGLVALVGVPFALFQLIYRYSPFKTSICQINEFIRMTDIGVSVLSLSVISIDRYKAIMYPFKRQMRRMQTIASLAGSWLVSILILSPYWIYTVKYGNSYGGREVEICTMFWPNHLIKKIYSYGFTIIWCFLPITLIGFCYCCIAVKLWGTETIGERSQRQLNEKLANKGTIKMLITMVIIFVVCWLPIYIVQICDLWLNNDLTMPFQEHFHDVILAIFWMWMSKSMYNPIIYCLMNARFRTGFKKTLRRCLRIHYDSRLDTILFSSTKRRSSI